MPRRPITATFMVAGMLAGILSLCLIQTDNLPACTYEDGSNSPIPCRWNAQKQGNGQGTSVTIWTKP